MKINNFIHFLLVIIFSVSFCNSQNVGYIKFDESKIWLVQVGDSVFTSNKIVSIKPGNYPLKARPQISYNWPSIYVEDQIIVTLSDTLNYSLSKNVSINQKPTYNAEPTTVNYSNTIVSPEIKSNIYIKNGLMLGAIATNWLSFYLKRVADSHYNKYNRASNSIDIRNHKKDFRDFDLYSQISLGVSSALLSGYIYFTLNE